METREDRVAVGEGVTGNSGADGGGGGSNEPDSGELVRGELRGLLAGGGRCRRRHGLCWFCGCRKGGCIFVRLDCSVEEAVEPDGCGGGFAPQVRERPAVGGLGITKICDSFVFEFDLHTDDSNDVLPESM